MFVITVHGHAEYVLHPVSFFGNFIVAKKWSLDSYLNMLCFFPEHHFSECLAVLFFLKL